MPLWGERPSWSSWQLPDSHLAPVLVLPGEHTLLLHQHLPEGPHFLPDLLLGVPGWAKTGSGLLWSLPHGPAEEFFTFGSDTWPKGLIQKGGGMVTVIRAWRTAGFLLSPLPPLSTSSSLLPASPSSAWQRKGHQEGGKEKDDHEITIPHDLPRL